MTEQSSRWNEIRKRLLDSWHYVRDSIGQQWDRFSEDDLKEVEGRIEKLADKIQERYGVAREEALRQIDVWAEREIPYLGGSVKHSPATRWAIMSFIIAAIMGLIAFTPITEWIDGLTTILFWVFLAAGIVLAVWRLTKGKG